MISNVLIPNESSNMLISNEIKISNMLISNEINMADNSSSIDEQAFVIVLPSGLPHELHQCASEYFPVADSGALSVGCYLHSLFD